ncbi:MAG: hypothetical protein P4L59_17230 [Desulfosporosinus sp.]|nr:hypothetical protein [Desulfosporosinus sp.]
MDYAEVPRKDGWKERRSGRILGMRARTVPDCITGWQGVGLGLCRSVKEGMEQCTGGILSMQTRTVPDCMVRPRLAFLDPTCVFASRRKQRTEHLTSYSSSFQSPSTQAQRKFLSLEKHFSGIASMSADGFAF